MGNVRESKVDYWLTEDGLLLLECWRRDGDTLAQICDKVGINDRVFRRWRDEYPEIREAVSRGKDVVDYMVENALLKRALGYKTTEVKVTIGKKNVGGEFYEVLKETTTKELAPDVTACLAWLNNKKFDAWKRNRDKIVNLEDEDNNLTITINRGNPDKDGLGDNVNQSVTLSQKEEQERQHPEKPKEPEKDPDEWPEDWSEEDE